LNANENLKAINLILQFLGQLCGKSCNESCQEACGLAQAKLILPFIITSHLFVVDEITRLYGTPGVTTIRNESDKDTSHEKFVTVLGCKINPMTYIRYFFSFYQFCGAGSHLLVTSKSGRFWLQYINSDTKFCFLDDFVSQKHHQVVPPYLLVRWLLIIESILLVFRGNTLVLHPYFCCFLAQNSTEYFKVSLMVDVLNNRASGHSFLPRKWLHVTCFTASNSTHFLSDYILNERILAVDYLDF
jgi:hypothetical protein